MGWKSSKNKHYFQGRSQVKFWVLNISASNITNNWLEYLILSSSDTIQQQHWHWMTLCNGGNDCWVHVTGYDIRYSTITGTPHMLSTYLLAITCYLIIFYEYWQHIIFYTPAKKRIIWLDSPSCLRNEVLYLLILLWLQPQALPPPIR